MLWEIEINAGVYKIVAFLNGQPFSYFLRSALLIGLEYADSITSRRNPPQEMGFRIMILVYIQL